MESIVINEDNLLKVGFIKHINMYKYEGWWVSLNKGSEWLLSKGATEVRVNTLEDIGTHIGIEDICYPIRSEVKPKVVLTYLMFDGRLYKIGKSTNPKGRLKQLQTGNISCKLLCYGTGVSEEYLHKYYSAK